MLGTFAIATTVLPYAWARVLAGDMDDIFDGLEESRSVSALGRVIGKKTGPDLSYDRESTRFKRKSGPPARHLRARDVLEEIGTAGIVHQKLGGRTTDAC